MEPLVVRQKSRHINKAVDDNDDHNGIGLQKGLF